MSKIGIIGYGYVGSAVADSYPDAEIFISDPAYPELSRTLPLSECRAIFVCVPTPSTTTGACDTRVLEDVLKNLQGFAGIVVAKSTATPEFYQRMEHNLQLNLVHVPEFLTQARAKYDYVNPHKIVVGCQPHLYEEVADLLMSSAVNFDRVKIEYCTIGEASFFKYLANCMLAMKVVANNEFYELAEELGLSWESITNIAKTDSRLGNTHWAVPGPDGERGFGGACFPKDTESLANIANELGVELSLLKTAIEKNKKYR